MPVVMDDALFTVQSASTPDTPQEAEKTAPVTAGLFVEDLTDNRHVTEFNQLFIAPFNPALAAFPRLWIAGAKLRLNCVADPATVRGLAAPLRPNAK